jgi:nucleoside-diphosphate-sugar epimerase
MIKRDSTPNHTEGTEAHRNDFSDFRSNRCPSVLNKSQMVLVIGGAGYVGSVLCRKLLKLGYKVRILDLMLYGNESIQDLEGIPEFQCYIGDFRHVDKVVEAMDGINTVIHLGAIVGDAACQINPKVTVETNLIATRIIAQIAKAFRVARMVFASTCSVYGASNEKLTEQSSLNPVSLYARTKINAEQILLAMADNGFTPVILRFATIYGISYRPRFDLVVNLLSAMAQAERKITITGGQQWRPFVHVTDVANAIIKVLEAPKELVKGEIFNVGATEENYQIEQVGRIIKHLLPNTDVISQENITDRRNYFVQFDKIKNTLNFTNSRTVSHGIKEISHALQMQKITNYRAPNYNNYLALKSASGGCRDYISESVWYDLLQAVEEEKLPEAQLETANGSQAGRKPALVAKF